MPDFYAPTYLRTYAHILIVALLSLVFFSACSGQRVPKYATKPGKGFYHIVKPGETIWEIARDNHVTAQQIAEWNNLQDPDKVAAGMRIYVPKTRAGGARHGRYDAPLSFDRDHFRWPVRGNVISGFGMRDGNRHDGVDIKAPGGTPVHSAAEGEVVYSGNLRGYGNLLILRHADRYYTTYAHNQKNLAPVGRRVKAGEVIALVGATGRTTGPHLHFEVRLGATARNPLFFMPTENNAEADEIRVAKGKSRFKKFDREKFEKKRAQRKKKIDKVARRRS